MECQLQGFDEGRHEGHANVTDRVLRPNVPAGMRRVIPRPFLRVEGSFPKGHIHSYLHFARRATATNVKFISKKAALILTALPVLCTVFLCCKARYRE